ncbi:MAG: AtpZ/AtpI family protein [Phycisphaerales bacterium]|nr:AtpZ/AtpI family protein [Phycisphaerales bacterium]
MADAPRDDDGLDGPGGDELDPEKSFAQTWHEPPPPPDIPDVLKERPGAGRTHDQPSSSSSLSGVGRAWGIAMDFIFTILAGAGLGWVIGRWQGHIPGWVLGGLSIGFAAALVRIIRATQRQERLERAAAEERRKGRP